MTYLLDTNALVSLLRGTPPQVRRRFQRAVDKGATLLVSAIASHELWSGVERSTRRESNAAAVDELLGGPMTLVGFDDEDARAAGRLRAELDAAGTPIGPYDVLLAGQAIARGAVLVTSNVREFERVPGLRWEDWGKAGR